MVSLLRSAGHGPLLDRNIDLCLSSRVIIDVEGNVKELTLGAKDQSRTRFQQEHRGRHGRRGETPNGDDHGDDLNSYWDLPTSIGNLRHLKRLVLYRCRSLPMNELPNLLCLELHFCHGNSMAQHQPVRDWMPPHRISDESKSPPSGHFRTQLSNLRTLEIHGGAWNAEAIDWMKCLVSTTMDTFHEKPEEMDASRDRYTTLTSELEILRFSFLSNDLLDAILKFLSPIETDDSSSCGRCAATCGLKRLSWVHSEMTDWGLQRLICEVVLPYHANLYNIDVSGNQIRSLQFLLDMDVPKSGNNEQSPSYHFLRILNLQHNPILKHRTNHPRELEAFEVLLLYYFPLLGSLTPSWENWDDPIEYLLRINRGGRVLVEGNQIPQSLLLSLKKWQLESSTPITDHNNIVSKEDLALITNGARKTNKSHRNTTTKEVPIVQTIRLSMWPVVLHQAYKTSSKGFLPERKDPTAIYYLIRNGPALSEVFASSKYS